MGEIKKVFKDKVVLVVDDEPEIVEIIADLLEDTLECKAHRASDGLEALKLLESQKFDLVCSDLKMPVMDGAALVKALREGESSNKDVGVLIISGYPDDSDRVLTRYEKVLILDKPINEKRLVANASLFLQL